MYTVTYMHDCVTTLVMVIVEIVIRATKRYLSSPLACTILYFLIALVMGLDLWKAEKDEEESARLVIIFRR